MAQKKKKLNKKKLLIFILFLYIIGYAVHYIFNEPIRNIYIYGNSYISDNEIINIANIKNYPSIFKINTTKIKTALLKNPLIKDVEIKRNNKFELIINIIEYKIICYYKSADKYLLENNKSIDNNNNYIGFPILVNYTKEDILKEMLAGLGKLDYGTISGINEIEYSPSTNEKGEPIDNTRFLLRMNDGNKVYINTSKINTLKYYQKIYASLKDKKGIIHLDSGDYMEVQ